LKNVDYLRKIPQLKSLFIDEPPKFPDIKLCPDPITDRIDHDPLPPLELVEQSLKSTIYDPFHNSESLEFYGDSILKLVASLLVFLNHPEFDEHNLSVKRQDFISNRFLRLINIGNRFFEHMMTEKSFMNFPGLLVYKETLMS